MLTMKHIANAVSSLCVAVGCLYVVPNVDAETQERQQQLSRYQAMLLSAPMESGSKEVEAKVTALTQIPVVDSMPVKPPMQKRLPRVPTADGKSKKPGLIRSNTFTQQAVIPRQSIYRTVESDKQVPLPALQVSASLPQPLFKADAILPPNPKSNLEKAPVSLTAPATERRATSEPTVNVVADAAVNSNASVVSELDGQIIHDDIENLFVDPPETAPIANVPPPIPKSEIPRVALIPQEVESIVTPQPEVLEPPASESSVLEDSVFEPQSTSSDSTMMSPAPVAYAPWIEDEAQQYSMSAAQPPLLFSHDVNPVCGDNCSDWPCDVCGMTYCCCSRPCWRVRADAVFLHRSRADGFAETLLGCNCATPTTFQPDSLSMDFHGAPRLTVIRDNQCGGCDLEGSYYIVDHWTGNQSLEGPIIALGTDLGIGEGDVRYESKLQTAELNLFKDVNNWNQFMIGFRWLELDEHSAITGSGTIVPMFDERVDVRNSLVGGQIGWRKTIWDAGGFVTANVTTKGGLFNNSIHRRTSDFGTSPLGKDELSFIGEVDISVNCEITQCWSLNAGYQFLWITDIAEAPDQFFSPDEIFDDATAFLHGARIGFTKTF